MKAELIWERLKSDDGLDWWRAPVPGGWLVQPDAITNGAFAATFVPDPEHTWGKPDAT